MGERRIRTRLSINEIDATWIYTGTNRVFRFHEGAWEESYNVFYGKDYGWMGPWSEPKAVDDDVFIEMLPDQKFDDPEFISQQDLS